jgi:hypothetical protein
MRASLVLILGQRVLYFLNREGIKGFICSIYMYIYLYVVVFQHCWQVVSYIT